MDEVRRKCRRSHKKKHYDLKSAPYIIHVTKTIRIRKKGHVVQMGDSRGA
jgi:hypothetical protein